LHAEWVLGIHEWNKRLFRLPVFIIEIHHLSPVYQKCDVADLISPLGCIDHSSLLFVQASKGTLTRGAVSSHDINPFFLVGDIKDRGYLCNSVAFTPGKMLLSHLDLGKCYLMLSMRYYVITCGIKYGCGKGKNKFIFIRTYAKHHELMTLSNTKIKVLIF